MAVYKCRYFKIIELVPESLYTKRGMQCWDLFDDRILRAADRVREIIGLPMIVNDWHKGGIRTDSGYRVANSVIGAVYSQHKYGRALDMVCPKMRAQAVRDRVLVDPVCNGLITCIEDGVEWLHIDCRNNPSGKISLFSK